MAVDSWKLLQIEHYEEEEKKEKICVFYRIYYLREFWVPCITPCANLIIDYTTQPIGKEILIIDEINDDSIIQV